MPTSDTVTTIYNKALDIVAENPCGGPSDIGPTVRWLNRNYSGYVQSALRENPWNFACEYFESNATATNPNYRWGYSYDLPNGWLRVLPITYNGERGGRPIPHEVKGNKLYINSMASLRHELVMDKQNPGEWDPMFATLIAARLARGMAHRFTHKASFAAIADKMATEAYEAAELVNAFEGTPEPTEAFDILRVRGESDPYRRW